MKLLLICLAIYLLGIILFYRFIKIAHSKGGRWENIDPDGEDLFFMLLPIVNLFMALTTDARKISKKR